MNLALDTIATGLSASQTMMDTIADNHSNVNTTGFKSETPEFQTLLYQDGIQPGANSTGQTVYPSGLELGTGVKVASIKDTLTQGTLTSTGNPLDLAINGSGYFQVLLPTGQTVYTRDGSFQPNASGQLVTSAGYQVLPNVTIPSNATSVTIGTDGTGVRHFARLTDRDTGGADSAGEFCQPARLAAAGRKSLCGDHLLRHGRCRSTAEQRARLGQSELSRILECGCGAGHGEYDFG